jgi:hypothetical protein
LETTDFVCVARKTKNFGGGGCKSFGEEGEWHLCPIDMDEDKAQNLGLLRQLIWMNTPMVK